ncbi:MAG: protease inhibitor I42 family protein [Treponema sp.]|nr:protease inhibitor I42 family protein [Treponema sp.]
MTRLAFIVLAFSSILVFAGCAGKATIVIKGNQSVGDAWSCTSISPEGVVSEVSNKYRISFPAAGSPGTFIFTFKAIAQGEAEVVLTHYFRGEPAGSNIYNAVVDKRKKLTLTKYMLESYNTVEDALYKISGIWYNRNNKTAIRFLENTVQIAKNTEEPEDADFIDYAAYTIEIKTEQRERFSVQSYYLIINKIPENENEELRIAIYHSPASLRFYTGSRWLEETYYRNR